MQFWSIIQLSIIIKGRIKRAICILNLIATLITKLILFLQATVTAIICLVAFLTIGSKIRLIKVIETVPLTVTSPMLLTINLKQKATDTIENLRVIIVP